MNKKSDFFSQLMLRLRNILDKKPSFEKMKEEVRLMGFNIRPVEGNPLIINRIRDVKLIEVLWTLGKIDSLMEENFHRLNKQQKKLFLQLIKAIQEKLSLSVSLAADETNYFKKDDKEEISSYLMLEVFRKNKIKKNIN